MEHYNALSPYLKKIASGCKICKLSLSAGCTCPNHDGTLGTRGLVLLGKRRVCRVRLASIPEQLEQAKLILGKKAHNARFIAYFQEFTNTYGDVSGWSRCFCRRWSQTMSSRFPLPRARTVCRKISFACSLACVKKKPIFVELGLQTMHDETARYIRRGYRLPVFDAAVDRLHTLDVEVVAHMILGLPGETPEMIVADGTPSGTGRCGRGQAASSARAARHGSGTGIEKGLVLFLQMDEYITLLERCLCRAAAQRRHSPSDRRRRKTGPDCPPVERGQKAGAEQKSGGALTWMALRGKQLKP